LIVFFDIKPLGDFAQRFFCETISVEKHSYSMKILQPADSEHQIRLIPRKYPVTALTVSLFDEFARTNETIANTYFIKNGYLYLTFTKTVVEAESYQLLIIDAFNDEIYRGKIYVTSQDPQTYNPTTNVYTFE